MPYTHVMACREWYTVVHLLNGFFQLRYRANPIALVANINCGITIFELTVEFIRLVFSTLILNPAFGEYFMALLFDRLPTHMGRMIPSDTGRSFLATHCDHDEIENLPALIILLLLV